MGLTWVRHRSRSATAAARIASTADKFVTVEPVRAGAVLTISRPRRASLADIPANIALNNPSQTHEVATCSVAMVSTIWSAGSWRYGALPAWASLAAETRGLG